MSVAYRLIAAHELDVSLISAWRVLQRSNPDLASPYFSPEFTQAVARIRNDVRVVVVENDGRVVALFPHQRSAFGMGKPVGGPLSDFHGVIAAAGSEWQVDGLMAAAKLSIWQFDHFVGEVHRIDPHVSARATSPIIELGDGYDRYIAGRRNAGSNFVRKTEGLARKLEREHGDLIFTLHDPSDDLLAQLIGWKRDQYRRAGITDVFGVTWTRDLLHEIAGMQTESFCGQFSVLRAGGRAIAAHMGMRSSSMSHYWFPAYDPEFSRFSAGTILVLRMAETLAGIGVKRIDLGKGESQYKDRLMTGAVEILEGSVERPSFLRQCRRINRYTETIANKGRMAAPLRVLLKAIRRIQHKTRFR